MRRSTALIKSNILVLLLVLVASASNAESLEGLMDEGHLKVDYRIAEEGELVLFQPVTLEIEIATDRWFSRGTRIERFDFEDALVYRSSENSTNSTRSELGQTWAVQLWSLVFYPQRSGQLEIPAIDVFISANAEGNIIVDGTLSLASKPIDIVMPAAMVDVDEWVATSRLMVRENYQGLKEAYQPGDAITRTISMQVEGAPAMMLPGLEAEAVDGLAVYSVQPKVREESNRGVLIGHREQEFIYTIERAGRYKLPAYAFHWWNLAGQKKEVVELPPMAIATKGLSVDQGAATDDAPGGAHEDAPKSFGYALLWPLLGLAGVALLYLGGKRFGLYERIRARRQQKDREAKLVSAIRRAEPLDALQHLYELLEEEPRRVGRRAEKVVTLAVAYQADAECSRLIQRLKEQCYGSGDSPALSEGEALQLLGYLKKELRRRWPWEESLDLRLNA